MKIILALMVTMGSLAIGSQSAQANYPEACQGKDLIQANTLVDKNGLRDDLTEAQLADVDNTVAAVGSEKEFVQRAQDESLSIDGCGAMVYSDTFTFKNKTNAIAAPPIANITPNDVFNLETHPGASKTLYLNFVGGQLTGSSWNEYTSQPSMAVEAYSIDNSSEFSAQELTNVYNIFKVIEEDFAPFNVNVTTKPPTAGQLMKDSASDQVIGIQAFFTSTESPVYGLCRCNGVAGLPNFDVEPSEFNSLNTTWAFVEQAGTPINLAQTGAHELGHTFGLDHDGTINVEYYSGNRFWAPIMGNTYSSALGQWSKGEYRNANNRQDDMAIIGAVAGYVQDDYGNSIATATPLNSSLTSGQIHNAADVDAFSFVAQGQTIVHVRLPLFTNLKTSLKIYDSAGNLVIQENRQPNASGDNIKAAGLESSIYTELTPGNTYYAVVAGEGWTYSGADTSDYGSVGAYAIYLETGLTGKPLAIVRTPLAMGYQNSPYSSRVTDVEGGVQPYSFSSPNLPSGLSLDPISGLLTGEPTRWGETPFTVVVTDALGTQTSASLVLISEVLTIYPELRITTVSLPNGQVKQNYNAVVMADGGDSIYEWSASGLPPGLTISNNVISGRPTKAGSFRVLVLVKSYPNGYSKVTSKAFTVKIAPEAVKPVFVTNKLPNGKQGKNYGTSVKLKSVSASTVYKLTGKLPPGIRMELNKKIPAFVDFSGKAKKAGKYVFTLKASNGSLSASKRYTIVIAK